jgi:predicted sulfurtransferase
MIASKRKTIVGLAILGALLSGMWVQGALAADGPLMTKEELKAMLGDSDLVILDARSGRDWKSSEFKIKGAQRAAPGDFDTWWKSYGKEKKVVFYCA